MKNLINFEEFNNQKNLYMVFDCTGSKYAICVENVLEVMNLPNLEQAQKMPNNTVGLLKYENIMINIFDIRFYLDVHVEKYDLSTKLIILRTDESIFGVIADDINDVININPDTFQKIPFDEEENLINSFYKNEQESINVLNIYDLESLLKAKTSVNKIDFASLFPKDEYSLQVLNDRSFSLKEKADARELQPVFTKDKFLAFRLNDSTYCINLNFVKEVAKNAKITTLPCTPDYVEGLINMRGNFFTVIDLKRFLSLQNQDYKDKSNVIILNSEEYQVGFLADEIYEVFEITEEELYKNRFMNETPFVFNEIVKDGKIFVILDMIEILNNEKMFIEYL